MLQVCVHQALMLCKMFWFYHDLINISLYSFELILLATNTREKSIFVLASGIIIVAKYDGTFLSITIKTFELWQIFDICKFKNVSLRSIINMWERISQRFFLNQYFCTCIFAGFSFSFTSLSKNCLCILATYSYW